MQRCRAWLPVLMLGLAPAAPAAGLQVAPIVLEIGSTETSTVLWLSNTGADALQAQIRVMAWTQVDQQERLEPTRDLVASPPMLEVAAGARQLVRIVRPAGVAPAERERSFRLMVDELPGQQKAGQGGVQFLMRYSVPVFIAPAGPAAAAQLHWHLSTQPPALEVGNTGDVRAQLSEVELVGAGAAPIVLSSGLLGYVLAGAQMRWPLPPDRAVPADAQLRARINGEPLDPPIAIGAGR